MSIFQNHADTKANASHWWYVMFVWRFTVPFHSQCSIWSHSRHETVGEAFERQPDKWRNFSEVTQLDCRSQTLNHLFQIIDLMLFLLFLVAYQILWKFLFNVKYSIESRIRLMQKTTMYAQTHFQCVSFFQSQFS